MPILTADERIGTRVSERYVLEAVVGTGGMGVLFRALDETTGRPVALKILKPGHATDPARIARFSRETRIARTLSHPNIAAVLDAGVDETNTPFLVMELLTGSSLEQELRERTLTFAEALTVVLPIGRALAAAHARGVIHRDLKPSNIFLCREANGMIVPKLLDFGIAKDPRDDFETQTGLMVGTPGYMAPEQARDGNCGPFTDVWGLAAVMYRCVMGHAPHTAPSVPEMLAKLISEPVPPFGADGVRKAACAVIDRALERDPERRHQTMQAFLRALESASNGSERAGAGEETQELFAGTLELPRSASQGSVAPEHPPAAAKRRPHWSAALLVTSLGLGILIATTSHWPSRTERSTIDSARRGRPAATPMPIASKMSEPARTAEQTAAARAAVSAPPPGVPSAAHERRSQALRKRPYRPAEATAEPHAGAADNAAAKTTRSPLTLPEPARPQDTGVPVVTEW